MDRRTLSLVVAALLLPLILRFAWFFPGFWLPRSVSTPDYVKLQLPAVPISTAAAGPTAAPSASTILLDAGHSNRFTQDEIQPFASALTQRGARLVLNTDTDELASQLKLASSYVVISPSQAFSPAEVGLIQSFVGRGGRLVVFTDATRGVTEYDYMGYATGTRPDVDFVLPLLEPFGLSINGDYLYDLSTNEGNFRNVYLKAAPGSDLTSGLGIVTLYGTHSVTTEGGSALLVGGQGTLSSKTDALPDEASQDGWAAAAINKDGNVLAFGDFSFLTSPYDLVQDNQLLIGRVADFLSTPRGATLADFPQLFLGPTVSLFVTSELQMTAQLTDAVGELQSTLSGAGLQLRTVQRAPAEGDRIVLGTYTSSPDLQDYVRPFSLQKDDFAEFVTLPPFGKLGQSGNGLLLFRTAAGGNTLVLLAASADDMKSLLGEISDGDLTGCLVQGNVAACSIGYGGSFTEATPTPGLIPTGAPTAGAG